MNSAVHTLLADGELGKVVDVLVAGEHDVAITDDLRRDLLQARARSDCSALAVLLTLVFLRARDDAAAQLAFRRFDAVAAAVQTGIYRIATPPYCGLELTYPPHRVAGAFLLQELCGRELPAHRAVVGHLHGGRVLGFSNIAVSESNRAYLEGFVHNPWRLFRKDGHDIDTLRLMTSDAIIAAYERVDSFGEAVFVGSQENFGHWLLNHVGRLFLKESLQELDGIPIVVSGNLTGNQEELLGLLGYNANDFIRLHQSRLASFRELWLPNMLFCARRSDPGRVDSAAYIYWTPEIVHALRRRLHIPSRIAGQGQRIYVTRHGARWRRLRNEEVVRRFLVQRGFAVLEPAGLSIREQMTIARDAGTIIGTSGAGMNLLLFAPSNATVIELKYQTSEMDVNPYICRSIGQKYLPIFGVPIEEGEDPLRYDFEIPLERLADAING